MEGLSFTRKTSANESKKLQHPMNRSQLIKKLPTFWQLTVCDVHNSSPLDLIRSPVR